ncbi:hypothetical protein [Pararhodobacter sp.]|uniref:hypothetical protein n=1 Tax=Pararhodobacter sp. TaxID=2127056 RepID=UPI002FE28CEC
MSAPSPSRGDLGRLAALLRQERAALIRGDYARLEALARRKIQLLDRLEAAEPLLPTPGNRALAAEIRAATTRNAPLFEAAIAGIREARALLLRARDRGRGQTYGRNGTRAALEPAAGQLYRRA